MAVLRRFRFSMAAIMMLVVTSASAFALFMKVRAMLDTARANPRSNSSWPVDSPAILLIGIELTAIAIAAVRKHTAIQMMIQATLACLMLLVLMYQLGHPSGIGNFVERTSRYWFQSCFALTVVLPLLAGRLLSAEMEPGPRLMWWRGTMESVLASFANLMLVGVGVLVEMVILNIL